MFTGIVEELGTVRHVSPTTSGTRLEIACSLVLDRLSVEDSVNVSGACLTVIERDDRGFASDIPRETAARTTLGAIVMTGIVTIDGVSLTVASVGKTYFEVTLVPRIAERTTLGALGVGEAANVEVDIVAKYVERLLRTS